MIYLNLKVLLAERNISISKLSEDTHISRTTITSLCNNTSKGIHFDTLETLCNYLKITPAEFIIFSSHNIDLIGINKEEIVLKITNNLNKTNFEISLVIEFDNNQVLYLNHYDEDENKFLKLTSIIKTLPPFYCSYLSNHILKSFLKKFNIEEEKVDFSILTNIY